MERGITAAYRRILSLLGEDVERYRNDPKGMWVYPKNGNGILLLAVDMRSHTEELRTVGYLVHLFKGAIKERKNRELDFKRRDSVLLGRSFNCVLCGNLVLEDADSLENDRWSRRSRFAAYADPYCDACLVERFPFYDGRQFIVPRSMYSPLRSSRSIVWGDLLHRLLVVSRAIERQKEDQPRYLATLEEALF